MKIIGQIYEAEPEEFSKFKSLKGNRMLGNIEIKRLKQSMISNGYLRAPIVVNERYEIIDGQHRFEAAKQINQKIEVIIAKGYGLKEVQLLNENAKNWSKKDYLKAYCDLGYEQYLKFREFMQLYPDFKIDACEALLTDSPDGAYKSTSSKEIISKNNKKGHYKHRLFKSGQLQINDYNKAICNANRIMAIKPYYSGFNRNLFVGALISIFKSPNYNHDIFIRKVSLYPTMLKHCATAAQYKQLIEEIYNYKNHNKVSLRYN